ncbi:MAG: amino acid transport protein [Acidobacteria bacterium]|nr:MAG: amino acid transport protein [Acidobacteriota bacterium]
MTLILGIVFSVIGMAAFAYGRKSKKSSPLIGGTILMIFPYFVPNPLLMVLIGAVTLVGMYLFPE